MRNGRALPRIDRNDLRNSMTFFDRFGDLHQASAAYLCGEGCEKQTH